MPKLEYWKDADGKIRTQDSEYHDQMVKYGFRPATEEESANAKEINARVKTPVAPTGEPVIVGANAVPKAEVPAPPVDTQLVERIKATGADEVEATRRAENVAKLMSQKPNYPTISQGVDEAGDIPSTLGTIAEGIAGGLSFGILPYLEGLAGDEFGGVDSAFSSENIERRRQASPTINLVADIGAGLAQAGIGALKSFAPRAFARFAEKPVLGGVVRAIEQTDILGRTARAASTDMAESVLAKSAAREGLDFVPTNQAAYELESIELKLDAARNALRANPSYAGASDEILERLAMDQLSNAERGVAEVSREASRVRTLDVVQEKVRKVGEKVTRGKISQKPASQIASERAVRERSQYIVERQLADTYDKLGFGERASYALATGLANAVLAGGAGAVRGAITAKQREAALRGEGVSQEQIDALGDSYAASAWDGFTSGATFGGALSLGIPVANEGIRAGLNLVRGAAKQTLGRLIPAVGSLLSDFTKEELGFGVKLGNLASMTDKAAKYDELANALQYQYDNMSRYAKYVQDEYLAATGTAITPSALQNKLRAFEDAFTIKDSSTAGRRIVDIKKLRRAMDAQPVQITESPNSVGSGYSITGDITFPPVIQELQDELAAWESTLSTYAGGRPYIGSPEIRAAGDLPSLFGGVPAVGGSNIAPMDGFVIPIDEGTGLSRLSPNEFTAGQIRESEEIIKAFSEKLRAGWSPTDFFVKLGIPGFAGAAAAAGAEGVIQGAVSGLGTAAVTAPVATFLYNLSFNPPAAVDNYTTLLSYVNKSQNLRKYFVESLTRSGQVRSAAEQALVDSKISETFGVKRGEKFTLDAESAKALYEHDKEILAKLATSDGMGSIEDVFDDKYDAIDSAYPKIGEVAKGSLARQVTFLNGKMPKLPKGWDVIRQGEYVPTPQQIYQYGLYSRYVHNPEAIYEDIAKKKYVPDAALEVLDQVYPQFYTALKVQLYEGLVQVRDEGNKVDAKQQAIIDKLLGRQTAGLSRADIKSIQASMVPQGSPAPQMGTGESTRVRLEREGTTSR